MWYYVFITIALGLYVGMNAFILLRLRSLLRDAPRWRGWLVAGLTVVALLFPLGRVWLHYSVNPASVGLIWLGSFWVVGIFYLGLFTAVTLAADTLACWRSGDGWVAGWRQLRAPVAWMALAVVAVLMVGGHANARHPVVSELTVELPPEKRLSRPWRLAVLSDLHAGAIMGRERMAGIVDQVNALRPDAVFLVGDIVDSELEPVVREKIGGELARLNAPFGVYAVTGNHEFIGPVEEIVDYLEQNGVTFLRDRAEWLGGEILLVGREDRVRGRFTGRPRAELAEVLLPHGHQPRRPVVLLDHQPKDLESPSKLGVDLMLSGHTHNGQLWPFNYVVAMQYEVVSGPAKVGPMQLYVLNGTGTWGPPVRVGNRPEILLVTLKPGANLPLLDAPSQRWWWQF